MLVVTPASAVTAHVNVNVTLAYGYPNAACGKGRHLNRQGVHILRLEAIYPHVSRQPLSMLGAWHAADRFVMRFATAYAIYRYRFTSEGSEQF